MLKSCNWSSTRGTCCSWHCSSPFSASICTKIAPWPKKTWYQSDTNGNSPGFMGALIATHYTCSCVCSSWGSDFHCRLLNRATAWPVQPKCTAISKTYRTLGFGFSKAILAHQTLQVRSQNWSCPPKKNISCFWRFLRFISQTSS